MPKSVPTVVVIRKNLISPTLGTWKKTPSTFLCVTDAYISAFTCSNVLPNKFCWNAKTSEWWRIRVSCPKVMCKAPRNTRFMSVFFSLVYLLIAWPYIWPWFIVLCTFSLFRLVPPLVPFLFFLVPVRDFPCVSASCFTCSAPYPHMFRFASASETPRPRARGS